MFDITIQHADKDKLHPYVMVTRELVNDESISAELFRFLVRLISKPQNWTWRYADLLKISGGEDRTLRRRVKEAVEAGYMQRTTSSRHGGRFQKITYIFSEKPIFQKVNPEDKNVLSKNSLGQICPVPEELKKCSSVARDKCFNTSNKIKALKLSDPLKPSKYLSSLDLSREELHKLKSFPDEAIEYALSSWALMRNKPSPRVAVLISLCKDYLKAQNNPSERPEKFLKQDMCGAETKEKLKYAMSLAKKINLTSLSESEYFRPDSEGVQYRINGANFFIPYTDPKFLDKIENVMEAFTHEVSA